MGKGGSPPEQGLRAAVLFGKAASSVSHFLLSIFLHLSYKVCLHISLFLTCLASCECLTRFLHFGITFFYVQVYSQHMKCCSYGPWLPSRLLNIGCLPAKNGLVGLDCQISKSNNVSFVRHCLLGEIRRVRAGCIFMYFLSSQL